LELLDVYGGNELSSNCILRYAYTKEFFETFSSLQVLDICLPYTLMLKFQNSIKPIVNSRIHDKGYVGELKEKHKFNSIKDIQDALAINTQCVKDLRADPGRDGILISANYIAFALDKLSSSRVIVNVVNKRSINQKVLPKNFSTFFYKKELRETKVSANLIGDLLQRAEELIKKQAGHPVFSRPCFKAWLLKHLPGAIRTVILLDRLICQQPIKVIVSYTEIANPEATLSLLALKYNLPFLNVQHCLTKDRTYLPASATYHCLWGKHYKDWLLERGIPGGKIMPIGSLRFYYSQKKSYLDKIYFTRQLNIDNKNIIITYTSQPFHGRVNLRIMQWINDAVRSLPITVMIRKHPRDKTNYRPFLNTQIKLTPRTLKLYDILYNSDFVMTVSSNTAIEASLLGKGIIVLQPKIPYHYVLHHDEHNAHLASAQAGPVIYNSQQLKIRLRKIVSNRAYRNRLYRQSRLFLQNTLQDNNRRAPELTEALIRQLL
jgi:hypothetical protein